MLVLVKHLFISDVVKSEIFKILESVTSLAYFFTDDIYLRAQAVSDL